MSPLSLTWLKFWGTEVLSMVKYAPDFQCQVFFNSLLYAFDWPLTLHIAYIHYGCSLTHIVRSFDLMAWNNTSRQQYSCVVWLFWRSYQHGTLVYLHQALKKIFQVTNWWNDSGLLQWTQSWTRKPPTARLSSAIFFDGWPKTALPSLDNVSKILQRSIHTKLDRL